MECFIVHMGRDGMAEGQVDIHHIMEEVEVEELQIS